MTREEAIYWIENLSGSWDGQYREARDMAIAALREQESLEKKQATSDWISVEERLPERNVKVLCYMNFLQSEETKGWGTCITENTYNGMFVGSGHRKPVWEWQSDFVTHWMPLPVPPKEEV